VQAAFALSALALVFALGCVFNAQGAFFMSETHARTLWAMAGYGVLACGMTAVIITGGIDLSVGSVVALVGVVFATLTLKKDMGVGASVPLSVLAGGAAGLLSGVLIGVAGLQPFIATLAMMAFARGLAKYVCQVVAEGAKITKYPTPPAMEAMNAHVHVLGVDLALGVLVLAGVVLVTWALLRRTTFGMRVYAIGDNETAARFAGLPVRTTKVLVYTYAGLLAGVAGVLFGAAERQGNPDGGVGYELTAIAMVVIGGTSLSGGRGGIPSTVLGMLTIQYLKTILDLNAIETYLQLMITGAIIVFAVVLPRIVSRIVP
jgi:ribose transport system permease protein